MREFDWAWAEVAHHGERVVGSRPGHCATPGARPGAPGAPGLDGGARRPDATDPALKTTRRGGRDRPGTGCRSPGRPRREQHAEPERSRTAGRTLLAASGKTARRRRSAPRGRDRRRPGPGWPTTCAPRRRSRRPGLREQGRASAGPLSPRALDAGDTITAFATLRERDVAEVERGRRRRTATATAGARRSSASSSRAATPRPWLPYS